MSPEACDRVKLCVRHLALKHIDTAAEEVETAHREKRHEYSESAQDECPSNLRRLPCQGSRWRPGRTTKSSQNTFHRAKEADERCGRRNGGKSAKPNLQAGGDKFAIALKGPLGGSDSFCVGEL